MGSATGLATCSSTATFAKMDSTSILRPSRLLCPMCESKPILELCQSGQSEFHRCRTCGGAWFYTKEINQAISGVDENVLTASDVLSSSTGIGETELQKRAESATCPCCGGGLVGVHDHRGSGAILRRCTVCYGSWLEQRDLTKIIRASGGLLSRVGRWMRQICAC